MDNKDMEQQIRELDDLLDIENDTEKVNQKEIAKKIKKHIGTRIYARVVITIIALIVLGTGGYFGSSKLISLLYYNPTSERELLVQYHNGSSYYQDDFSALLENYAGLLNPGKEFMPYWEKEKNAHSKGFGTYVYRFNIREHFDNISDVYTYNSQFTIKRNKRDSLESYCSTVIPQELFYNPVCKVNNAFIEDDSPKVMYRNVSQDMDYIKEIEELPDSTVFLADVSFDKAKTADETVNFMKKYPEGWFSWVAVNDPSFLAEEHVSTGISLNTSYGYNEKTLEKYPNLDEDMYNYNGEDGYEQHGGTELQQAYLSRLKLLMDHEAFVESVMADGIFLGGEGGIRGFCYSTMLMQEQYEYVSKNGIEVIGLKMEIGKQDLMKMIENNEIQYLYVEDVRLTNLVKDNPYSVDQDNYGNHLK